MAEEWPGTPAEEDEGQWPGRSAGATAGDFTASVGGGFNVGMGNVLGAPVDLMNLGLGMVGLGSQEPFGGSRSIQRGLSNLGMAPAPGEPYPVPFVGRTAEEVGAGAGALLPFMGVASRGSRAAQMARSAAAGSRPMPATVPGRVGRAARQGIVDPAVRMAQQNPALLASAELSAATSAGIGASVAQELFPGDPTAELTGQLAGGFLNPTGMLIGQLPRVGRGVKNVVYPFTKSGAKRQAAGRIQELSDAPGESLRRLREYVPTVPGEQLTPAQITGDPGLIALERAAARSSNQIEGEVGEMAAQTNRALIEEAADIRTPTDPSEAKAFFERRRKYAADLLDNRVQNAAVRARQRVEGLQPEQQRQQANVIAREELSKALKEARVTESRFWQRVPTDAETQTSEAKAVYDRYLSDIRKDKGADAGEIIPEFVKRRLRSLTEEEEELLGAGEKIDDKTVFLEEERVQSLQTLRSRVLQEARRERAEDVPNWRRVGFLDDLGEALLEDMGSTPGIDDALDDAIAFSRQLNDKFTRGPVGKVLGYERVGGASVPPELTLERTVGRLGPTGNVDAGALLRAVEENPAVMQGAAQDYLRSMFLSQVDPQATGRIRPGPARTWLTRNRELLERFPELRDQFQSAITNEQAAQDLAASVKVRSKSLNDRMKSATALYIGAKPDTEISRIRGLGGKRGPAMRSLVNTANKDTTGNALQGLKAAYVEDLMRRSQTASTDIEGQSFLDGKKMLNLLNQDSDITGPLLTSAEKSRLTKIAQRAEVIQDARRAGRDIDEILESEPNAIFDMLARITGAQIGGRLGAGAAGTPLVAAGAGSRAVRSITEKIPLERVSDVLVQASLDRKLMADLLARADTDIAAQSVGRRLNAWLVNAIPEYEDVYGEEQP